MFCVYCGCVNVCVCIFVCVSVLSMNVRHLLVVPKSAPRPPAYVAPSSLFEFRRQLVEKSDRLSMDSFLRFIPSIHSGLDFRLVLKFLKQHPHINRLQIDRALVARCEELRVLDVWLLLRLNPVPVELVLSCSNKYTDLSNRDLITLLKQVPKTANACINEMTRRLQTLDYYDIATFSNIAKKQQKLRTFFDRLAIRVSENPMGLTPRDVALLFNASTSRLLTAALYKYTLSRHSDFSDFQISLILHAVCGHHEYIDLFTVWGGNRINVEVMSPQSVALVAYSFGKMKKNDKLLFEKISINLHFRIAEFKYQSLALVVYGFSRLGLGDVDLLNLVADTIVERHVKRGAPKYTPTDVGMLAVAFSGFEHPHIQRVLMEMLKRGKELPMSWKLSRIFSKSENSNWLQNKCELANLNANEICVLMDSLGKFPNRNFRREILKKIQALLPVIQPETVPKLVGLMGKLGWFDESILHSCGKLMTVHLPSYRVDELVRFLFGLSELNFRDEFSISRVLNAIEKMPWIDLSPKQVSMMLLSLTRLRCGSNTLYDKLFMYMFESIHLFKSEQIVCNCLFAMCNLPHTNQWMEPIIKTLLQHISMNNPDITFEGIRQLQIFAMCHEKTHACEFLKKVSQIDTFDRAGIEQSIEQSSATHREISRYLSIMGQEHRNEVVWGPFSLDILLNNTNTVIEVDGPHHFFRNTPLRTSSSLLKHRLLTKNGLFNVIHIPYQEWLQCTSEAKKLAYLSTVLEEIYQQEPTTLKPMASN